MNQPVTKLREGFQDETSAPADPSPPPAAAEAWPWVYKLQHGALRIDPHHPEIAELTFRHPTAGDINYCGNPVVMGQERFLLEERKMTAMIGRLSGVLTPVLDQLDPRDWSNIAYRLMRFFIPTNDWWAQAPPTSCSTATGSPAGTPNRPTIFLPCRSRPCASTSRAPCSWLN